MQASWLRFDLHPHRTCIPYSVSRHLSHGRGLGPLFAHPAAGFGASHSHRASPASGLLGVALIRRSCRHPVGRWIFGQVGWWWLCFFFITDSFLHAGICAWRVCEAVEGELGLGSSVCCHGLVLGRWARTASVVTCQVCE